jgi:hypothetical protein
MNHLQARRIVDMRGSVEKRSFWKRPSVPPPARKLPLSYGLLIVAAAIAAVLAWPWWLGLVLLVPGMVLYFRAGQAEAFTRGWTSGEEGGRGFVAIVGALSGMGYAALASAFPDRYASLLLVGFLIVVCDPLGRLVNRLRRQPTGAVTSLENEITAG